MYEMPSEKHWALWAKTWGESWHALVYHLLDVGATAEALLGRLPQTHAFELERAEYRRLLVFLAASHDVGKANPFFQAKGGQAKRLSAVGFALPSGDEPYRHGQATGAFLKPWLKERLAWSPCDSEFVALAVGGHHGSFFAKEGASSNRLRVNEEPWVTIGKEVLDVLAETIGLAKVECPTPINPFLGWLSGFVTVADWLGSHEQMTTWENQPRDLTDYWQEARVRADKLLDRLGWQAPSVSSLLPLADILPNGAEPKALQTLAEFIAKDFSFAIVEAPPGEGKTETAFVLTEPRRSQGAGLFFALPTMATANGLYDRVQAFLRKSTGDDEVTTRRLHSQAWMFRDEYRLTDNEGDQAVQAEDWFEGSMRGLISPYGVGTIDQMLIATLKAKHGFVRLFALAGKVVVIDEVHAYDVYMSGLMDVLLGWLRALGCRVILLSATLPSNRRKELLQAWGVQGELPPITYPCITWIDGEGKAHAESVEVQKRKPVKFTLLAYDERSAWEIGAEEILSRVQQLGGLGVLVMNTVQDTQSAYRWLREQNLNEIELDLFHARFTVQDRDRIERKILNEYGKSGTRSVPRILVATQVVEQSLDLDFDHMVTALAPIDLLIQRAGRLHRHTRYLDGRLRTDGGPDERQDPEVIVVGPQLALEVDTEFGKTVYSKDVLLLTMVVLSSNFVIREPLDVAAAIESVYSETGANQIVGEAADQLSRLRKDSARKLERGEQEAERASIHSVDDLDYLLVEHDLRLDEGDERQGSHFSAKTRLEDLPSVTLALLKSEELTIHGGSTENRRDVFFATVRCTPPYPLWEALIQIQPLSKWSHKRSLSILHPVQLDDEVSLPYKMDYDADLGLSWNKKDAQL